VIQTVRGECAVRQADAKPDANLFRAACTHTGSTKQ
jgi:hypothetical protein